MAGHSKTAVYTAIGANSLVMIAKAGAWLATGSPAMLSEAIHSLADVGNQSLLALGIHKSGYAATSEHPYGFGRDRFIWALISAVGILFLGCGVTLVHGVEAFLHPAEHGGDIRILAGVLLFSFVVEAYSLWVAFIGTWRSKGDLDFFTYVRQSSDPMIAAILLEDAAAVFGVVLAAGGVALTYATGDARWDALSSIVIGLLLGYVAIALVRRNRTLLLGQAPPDPLRERIEAVLRSQPEVEGIEALKVLVVGSGSVHLKAEVDFDGKLIAKRLLEGRDLEALAGRVGDASALEQVLCDFGEEIASELARSVDRIESAVQQEVPEVSFADLEPDR